MRNELIGYVFKKEVDKESKEAAWHVIGNIYENPEMIENYTKPNSEAIVKNVLDDNPDIIRNFEKLVDNHIVDMLVKGEIPLDKIPDSKEKECIGLKVNWIKPKD